MTSRFRILASLAVASLSLSAVSSTAHAYELLDQLFNVTAADCGCATKGEKSGKHSSGKASRHAATPMLDKMTEWTRSVKCRAQSIELPCWQLPEIQFTSFDLFQVGSKKGSKKGKGQPAAAHPSSGGSGPAYDDVPDSPLTAPPTPVIDPGPSA